MTKIFVYFDEMVRDEKMAEDEGLEPPQAVARRFSRPVQYHYANPPFPTNLLDY